MMSKKNFNQMWETTRKELSKSNDENPYRISKDMDDAVNTFFGKLDVFEEDRQKRMKFNEDIEKKDKYRLW